MRTEQELIELQRHYEVLADQLLIALRSKLFTHGQPKHEIGLMYDRWRANAELLSMILTKPENNQD